MTETEATQSAALTEDERSEALRELAACARGVLTLSELAEAVQRVQASRTRLELEQAIQTARQHGVGDAGQSRRWLIVVLGGYRQKGRWRLGGDLRFISILGGAELDLRRAVV